MPVEGVTVFLLWICRWWECWFWGSCRLRWSRDTIGFDDCAATAARSRRSLSWQTYFSRMARRLCISDWDRWESCAWPTWALYWSFSMVNGCSWISRLFRNERSVYIFRTGSGNVIGLLCGATGGPGWGIRSKKSNRSAGWPEVKCLFDGRTSIEVLSADCELLRVLSGTTDDKPGSDRRLTTLSISGVDWGWIEYESSWVLMFFRKLFETNELLSISITSGSMSGTDDWDCHSYDNAGGVSGTRSPLKIFISERRV
jgi:hypothetical protein